jgi:hypothetical protein
VHARAYLHPVLSKLMHCCDPIWFVRTDERQSRSDWPHSGAFCSGRQSGKTDEFDKERTRIWLV